MATLPADALSFPALAARVKISESMVRYWARKLNVKRYKTSDNRIWLSESEFRSRYDQRANVVTSRDVVEVIGGDDGDDGAEIVS